MTFRYAKPCDERLINIFLIDLFNNNSLIYAHVCILYLQCKSDRICFLDKYYVQHTLRTCIKENLKSNLNWSTG